MKFALAGMMVFIVVVLFFGFGFLFEHYNALFPSAPNVVNPSGAPSAPVPPQAPSISLTIQKSAKGSSLFIEWQNLPGDTTGLNIYRSKTGSTDWSLWKSIAIAYGQLASGNATINAGKDSLAGYSFYVEAISGGGGSSNGTSTSTVLWTSPVTEPIVTTSTPPVTPNTSPPTQNNPNVSSTNPQTPTASSTQSSSTNPSPPSPASSSSTPSSPPPPSGIPYYNPKIQISGYGSTSSENFWVQHVDQKIEIGWQNLPQDTTSAIVYRSSNQSGPWSGILSQQNPGVNGSYSIQIVDDTLSSPYYYEMSVFNGAQKIATYGPVYLPPAQ